MTKHVFLQDAIRTIAQRAGIERPSFHITSVSQDSAGLFILQTGWPEGSLICEKIACAVAGFPKRPCTDCVALLPELVDEIIRAAQRGNDERHDAPAATMNRL